LVKNDKGWCKSFDLTIKLLSRVVLTVIKSNFNNLKQLHIIFWHSHIFLNQSWFLRLQMTFQTWWLSSSFWTAENTHNVQKTFSCLPSVYIMCFSWDIYFSNKIHTKLYSHTWNIYNLKSARICSNQTQYTT